MITNTTSVAVFEHASKPEWGLAVVAWERDQKRGYLFESGDLRVLKDGYFHLMREVDVSIERTAELTAVLRRFTSSAVQASNAVARPPKRRHVSLDEQLEHLVRAYPGGFGGEAWRTHFRSDPSGRVLKRHRDAAVERAADALSDERLASGDNQAALAAVAKLLTTVDLVPGASVERLATVTPEGATELIECLRAALREGEAADVAPFDRWVAALGAHTRQSPDWMLATAPLALARPHDHVCVRATSFRIQAVTLAPRLHMSEGPNGRHYRRMVSMAKKISDRAVERDLQPRDLLDIHDFIRLTTASKIRVEILGRRP